MHLPSPLPISV
ncbi:hypothetical protein ACHAWF_001304 [Thalassiosira exigua]